jgi:uncharacterized protein (DUF2141 family)
MRALAAVLILAALSAPAAAAPAGTATIKVTITGFRNDSGWMRISLFAGKKGFPGKHQLALRSGSRPIRSGAASFEFEGVPHGNYAIAVLHDENSNGKMDTNWIGIPKEGGGTSRDARAKFGPPSYSDAQFDLRQPALGLRIRMQYP